MTRAEKVGGGWVRRRRFRGRRKAERGILDAAAWVNVLLLLGMFALGGAKFVLQPGVRVRLPEGPFLDGAGYGARTVTLSGGGLMFYEDERTDAAGLERALSTGEGGVLLVEADEGTSYEQLMEVYAAAVRAGVDDVVLATRPPLAAPGR